MAFLLARLNIDMSDKPAAVEECGFPQLLFRNHWADSCLILPTAGPSLSTLRVIGPNTPASWSLPSTKPLTSRYRTSITSSPVHSGLTIHI